MARKPRLYRRKSRRRNRGRLRHGATPMRGAMNVAMAKPYQPLGPS